MKGKTFLGRAICLMLALVCVLTLTIPALAASEQEIIQSAKNGVVRVLVIGNNGKIGTGTAFAVGEGGEAPQYFITNRHVVNCDYEVWTYKDGNMEFLYSYEESAYKVYIMKSSHAVTYSSLYGYNIESSQLIPCDIIYNKTAGNPDIAVIRAAEPVEECVALPLAKSVSDADVASAVYALGFPAIADDSETNRLLAGSENMTVTSGVISRYGMMGTFDNCKMIVHDAKISEGNSGGPLLNSKGQIIGINTAMSWDSKTTTFYALSNTYIMSVCDELGIAYTVGSGLQWWLIALLAVLGVAIVVLIVVLVVKRWKKNKGEDPKPEPTPVDTVLRIEGEFGVFKNKRYKVDRALTIGCGSQNTLGMPEGTAGVSHKHCVVTPGNHTGEIQLTDLGSKYGTFLGNGQKLTANVPVVLRRGDRFWLGSKDQSFRVTGKGGV